MEALVAGKYAIESDESDHLWAAFSVPLAKGKVMSAESVARAAGVPKRVPVRNMSGEAGAAGARKGVTGFFAGFDHPEETGYDAATVAAFRALQAFMKKHLTNLRYYSFGEDQRVYGTRVLVGRAKDGSVAGIRAGRVWT